MSYNAIINQNNGINYKVPSTIYNKISNWHTKRTGHNVIGIIRLKRHVDNNDNLICEYLVCTSQVGIYNIYNSRVYHSTRVDSYTSDNGSVYARYFARSWSKWYQI